MVITMQQLQDQEVESAISTMAQFVVGFMVSGHIVDIKLDANNEGLDLAFITNTGKSYCKHLDAFTLKRTRDAISTLAKMGEIK